ncbi:hypothetical protein F5148DRAFT_755957 [Russula earlei]|uniref:Uncharacterized protein n=1 Tax=Russula earlei TaxID=71964 RepID=A0ACC0UCM0_9AGAM|nr:hypothetical protein F5148DRAFT_755957 [Russula earlei]
MALMDIHKRQSVGAPSSNPPSSPSPPPVDTSPPVSPSAPPVSSSAPPSAPSPSDSISSSSSQSPTQITTTSQSSSSSNPGVQTSSPPSQQTQTQPQYTPPQNTPPQNTPTTPVQPGQTTVAPIVTTRPNNPSQTISTTSTSIYTSLLVSTEANGVVVTTTIRSTIIIVPSTAPSSSSNTGAVVGGAAGGVAGLLIIFFIGLFCWRRNRRREDFDGNFDPDRVVRHVGHTDLAGAEVTPYSYDPTVVGGMTGPSSPAFSGDGSMRQYRDSQALLGGSVVDGAGVATVTSGSHYAPTSSDGVSAPQDSSHARSSSHGSAGFGPGFPVAQPYRPLSTKEREAMRQRGEVGLGLVSALEETPSEIIQHSDGGRVSEPVPVARPQEIPPSYDSISP